MCEDTISMSDIVLEDTGQNWIANWWFVATAMHKAEMFLTADKGTSKLTLSFALCLKKKSTSHYPIYLRIWQTQDVKRCMCMYVHTHTFKWYQKSI